jgi:hypothetical protein
MFARSALLAALATVVSAHGGLNFAVVDGTRYPAPNPNGDSGSFAIRAINDINPVKGTSNPDMLCGHGAHPAALVADASPGSTLEFSWKNGEGGTWVHNTGPVMTYMASCGATGCANFDGQGAEFFKISELGRKEGGDGRSWFMGDLTTGPDATLSVTLPTDLPAGEYLVRHELIAMQLGGSSGGAEFYPACFQIRLAAPSRSAAALPSGDQVVNFPGGYNDEDPGIHDPHVYDGPDHPYIFPGPALISSVTSPAPSGTDVPANPAPTPSSSTGGSISSTPLPAAPAPTSGCGNPNKKKVKRVVKRIVRQGPLIKKRSTTVKREEVKREEVKREVVPNAHHHARDIPNNVVRSRVMRGVF